MSSAIGNDCTTCGKGEGLISQTVGYIHFKRSKFSFHTVVLLQAKVDLWLAKTSTRLPCKYSKHIRISPVPNIYMHMTCCIELNNLRPFSTESEHFENLTPCTRNLKARMTFHVSPYNLLISLWNIKSSEYIGKNCLYNLHSYREILKTYVNAHKLLL